MSNKYSIGDFAKRIGRSVQTVRRWEREGKLVAKRHPSGHRYFDESDVRHLLSGLPKKRATVVLRTDYPEYKIKEPKELLQ